MSSQNTKLTLRGPTCLSPPPTNQSPLSLTRCSRLWKPPDRLVCLYLFHRFITGLDELIQSLSLSALEESAVLTKPHLPFPAMTKVNSEASTLPLSAASAAKAIRAPTKCSEWKTHLRCDVVFITVHTSLRRLSFSSSFLFLI